MVVTGGPTPPVPFPRNAVRFQEVSTTRMSGLPSLLRSTENPRAGKTVIGNSGGLAKWPSPVPKETTSCDGPPPKLSSEATSRRPSRSKSPATGGLEPGNELAKKKYPNPSFRNRLLPTVRSGRPSALKSATNRTDAEATTPETGALRFDAAVSIDVGQNQVRARDSVERDGARIPKESASRRQQETNASIEHRDGQIRYPVAVDIADRKPRRLAWSRERNRRREVSLPVTQQDRNRRTRPASRGEIRIAIPVEIRGNDGRRVEAGRQVGRRRQTAGAVPEKHQDLPRIGYIERPARPCHGEIRLAVPIEVCDGNRIGREGKRGGEVEPEAASAIAEIDQHGCRPGHGDVE